MYVMAHIAKVLELRRHRITGIEITDMTAKVGTGNITEYHTAVKIAFGVER
jgi:Dodecin